MSTKNVGGPLWIPSADGVSPQPSGTAQGKFDGNTVINATTNSVPVKVESQDTVGIQVSCPATGSPNGSIAIQGSNDIGAGEGNLSPDAASLTNWSVLSFVDEATGNTVQTKAVAGAQSYMFTIRGLSVRWIRFVWTNTSGSAKLKISMQQKGDGGR